MGIGKMYTYLLSGSMVILTKLGGDLRPTMHVCRLMMRQLNVKTFNNPITVAKQETKTHLRGQGHHQTDEDIDVTCVGTQ